MCAFKQLCREFNLKKKQFKLLCIIWIIIHGSLRVKTSAAEGPPSKYVADQNNPLGKHSHHEGSIYNPGDGLLETWCYNPNGSDCAWYRECLAKTYPCEASNDSYALGFAEVICNSFNDNRGRFSPRGREWIDNTRACLQKSLVPMLSSTTQRTCTGIQKYAYSTHTTCYITSLPDKPTFCELPVEDWLRTIWIVKQSFIWETLETFKQGFAILNSCFGKMLTTVL